MIHPEDLPKLTIALADAMMILFELPDSLLPHVRGRVASILRENSLISYTERYDSCTNIPPELESWEEEQPEEVVTIGEEEREEGTREEPNPDGLR